MIHSDDWFWLLYFSGLEFLFSSLKNLPRPFFYGLEFSVEVFSCIFYHFEPGVHQIHQYLELLWVHFCVCCFCWFWSMLSLHVPDCVLDPEFNKLFVEIAWGPGWYLPLERNILSSGSLFNALAIKHKKRCFETLYTAALNPS